MRFLVRSFGDGPGQSRTEAVRRSYGNHAVSAASHGNRTKPVRLPYRGRAEMIRRLCGRLVVLSIRVLKVYNFTFLRVLSVDMAPETKGRKGKRFKKEHVDPLQGSARSQCGHRGLAQVDGFISVRFYGHCTVSVRLRRAATLR